MRVCFLQGDIDPKSNLELFSRMTPKSNGVWKDMVGVSNPKEADWNIVIDSTSVKTDPDRTLYMSAHPKMDGYDGYVDNTDKPHRLDNAETFGFGEWWLCYDYDYLSNLPPIEKTKEVCCIMSNASGGYGRDRRKEFVKSLGIPLYGRIAKELKSGSTHHFGKEPVLAEHKYSVEIDVGPCRNYFSERVFDSLLMWCLPIYWGCTNLEDFLPRGAFGKADVWGASITYPEYDLKAIKEAREMILNKYQLWPRVYDYIGGL